MALSGVAAFAQQEAKARSAVLLDGVAAYVNDEVITISDIMNEVRRTPIDHVPLEQREKRLRELYKMMLDAMVDRKLLLSSARKAKMQLQPWAVEGRIREIVANNFDGDQTKLYELLAERKISIEEWKKGLEEELMIAAIRYQQVDKRVAITPSELRAEYDTNKARYQTQQAVAVSMIVLDPPEKEGDASVVGRGAEIFAGLQKGASFAALAKTYSKDSKAADGGSWGKVNPEDVFRKELVAELGKLKPGEVSPLVTLDGYGYILRKDDQQDVRTLNFDEAAPFAENRLKIAKSEKLYRELIQRVRQDAYIKIFELPTAK